MSNYIDQILAIILEVAKTDEGRKLLTKGIAETINTLVGTPAGARPPCQHPLAHLIWLGKNQVRCVNCNKSLALFGAGSMGSAIFDVQGKLQDDPPHA